ncbi:MAG TPA: hypothetical protein DCZ80_03820 [Legionellales bacterium]|nr:hypothetical protein [Legionellales bacterium]
MQWRVCCGLLTLSLMSYASDSLYGMRYCEIVSSQNFADFYIYNTNGLNACPPSWWAGLKDKDLEKKYKYKFVHLSGPRIWLIDSIQNPSASNEIKNFNGQKLRRVASFHPKLSSILNRHGPYIDYLIKRQQAYQFNKGRVVYELVSPQGKVYVMHSLSQKHQYKTPESLNGLSGALKLPKGWQLKYGEIQEDKILTPVAQTIHVMQDEFENTYQLTSQDFLK